MCVCVYVYMTLCVCMCVLRVCTAVQNEELYLSTEHVQHTLTNSWQQKLINLE